MAKKYGSAIPDYEEVLDLGVRAKEPLPWVQIPLQAEMGRLSRFAAKVALGGGAAIWGDQFSNSLLAKELRKILLSPDGNFEWERMTIPFEFAQTMMDVAARVGQHQLPAIAPPTSGTDEQRVSQLTLVPMRHRQFPQPTTAVFVNILGFPLFIDGLPLPGALPDEPVLPVVVREIVGKRYEIWEMDRLFFGSIEERFGDN